MSPLRQYAANAVAAPFLVGGLAVAVFVTWAANDAGYASTTWYPGALFLLALAVVTAVAYGRLTPSRPALVAIAFLAVFTAWCGLSILWSSNRGIAWDGANRTLLYLVVFALFASVPWHRESIPLLLCCFSLGVLGIGLIDLARAAGDATPFFIKGRLSAPAGYANAACALYLLAFWPLAYLAARREVPPLVRGASLAAATALAELALLAQSRGSLFAVPIAVVAFLALVPRRLRTALPLVVVAVAAVSARGRLLDLFDPIRLGEPSRGPVHAALAAIGLSAAAVFGFWTLLAYADRRIEIPSGFLRIANVGALALVAAALITGATTFAAADPGPGQRLSDAWRHFKGGYPEERGGSHFVLGLGSNRYDFWRVALLEFRRHPVEGVGVDNFAHDYVRERRSSEEPLYPHSLALRVLSQTGIGGAIFFAGFIGAAACAVVRSLRRRGDLAAGMALAGVAAAVYIGIHGALDWFWEFPALLAPAMAWLGLAAAPERKAAHGLGWSWTRFAVAATIAVGVATSLTLPWLAELNAQRAAHTWARHPARAFSDLDRARTLNPVSSRADLLAGAIASRVDDLARMQFSFRRAVERDPRDWYAHLELGLAKAGLGRRKEALAELERASKLNPREEIVKTVLRQVRARRAVDRDRIDRQFVERVRARVGP